jgi:hypothetical protein
MRLAYEYASNERKFANGSLTQMKVFREYASEPIERLCNFHYHKSHNSDYFSYRVAALSRNKYLIDVINPDMALISGVSNAHF